MVRTESKKLLRLKVKRISQLYLLYHLRKFSTMRKRQALRTLFSSAVWIREILFLTNVTYYLNTKLIY